MTVSHFFAYLARMKFIRRWGLMHNTYPKAEKALRASVEALPLPEVRYFIETFVPSLTLTLDELG
jgi:5'-deoxynucleotidase YfbR-like HD superfamily hydrolase